jgi:predicted DNA-binding transcriptional regulator AlpA
MPNFDDSTRLIRDADIARLTSMSKSWVRKQRMNRRRGLPHVLTIDPVRIGSVPRYRLNDVEAWLAAQRTQAK